MKKLLLLLPFALAACTSQPYVPPQNTEHWATAVSTQHNMYQVDDKLYRSEQLSAQDLPLLQQNKIKSIVNLRFFDRDDDDVFQPHGIQRINTPLLTWAITPKDVAQVLHRIFQQ